MNLHLKNIDQIPGLETKNLPLAIRDIDEAGTFVGYASFFGSKDLSNDMIVKGAFKQAIKKYGTSGIKMLWQHNPSQPIGYWLDIREDNYGLAVRGQLLTNIKTAAEALILLKSHVVDGLSIGFRTIRSRIDRVTGIRKLLEVDLCEISIVTFPMLPNARITAVKGCMLGFGLGNCV